MSAIPLPFQTSPPLPRLAHGVGETRGKWAIDENSCGLERLRSRWKGPFGASSLLAGEFASTAATHRRATGGTCLAGEIEPSMRDGPIRLYATPRADGATSEAVSFMLTTK